ncbi:NAD(P)/FAD-dependent oxidoreductase [Anaerosacchariphilus polymeriproducens]|uniref:FAD-dependent oxidoreductase n=1 Tax=Anaerosacchariphilus polymeriproducens TaxID=1812858 RepID=A0A371AU96_9FIRM|nr:FAD-dependent oxidoreductase [Anaerosacchariphilus polymeriproducens]RDU23070.1 FAD-dependent oxidoreductase [Anaerosacchariphilus polymeriproducens]
MIRIQQVKLELNHTKEDMFKVIEKTLRVSSHEIIAVEIVKKSIDARKKSEIKYVYTIDVEVKEPSEIIKRTKNKHVSIAKKDFYQFPDPGINQMKSRPVIVGSGPAGLFCGLMLAKAGYAPILIERGESVEKRKITVDNFWDGESLNSESNVQFGEGGAGTFSDGKLNTLVKDPTGRNRKVLEIFVKAGAPEEILYINKPHIGTDILVDVVKNIRNKILEYGGDIYFDTCMKDLLIKDGKVSGVELKNHERILTDLVILAIGHSARDTFQMLSQKPLIEMTSKAFAIGVRIEHPQSLINNSQYGVKFHEILPNASYKLATTLENKRGVYSFCMCPGGYVVNASSEPKRLAVNGMSYHSRNSQNANSAIIVTVTPEDFEYQGPLAGMEYQQRLEEAAYLAGEGRIPIQLFGDFCNNKSSTTFGDFDTCIKGNWKFSDLNQIIPKTVADSLKMGIMQFEHNIKGFSKEDAILSGVESRTSSPVRIPRDTFFESKVKGLYPCGEGAGYAGGIMSAAMDGLKVAEAIAKKYKKYYNS